MQTESPDPPFEINGSLSLVSKIKSKRYSKISLRAALGASCSKTVCKTTMFESLTLGQKKAIAVVCAAVLLLDDEPERPNKPRVGQEVLPSDPKTESTWATIWAKGDGRALLKLLNLHRAAFELGLGIAVGGQR